jgi:AraC-like DNA-binding protein
MALIAGKKTRVLSDYILLIWLLLILANLATFFIVSIDNIPKYGWEKALIAFSEVSLFLHGSILWLYTCSLTRPFFRLAARHILHGIPFVAGLICLLLAGMNGRTGYVFREWLLFFQLISLLIYAIAVIRQLRRYRSNIKHIFSNTEEKYLDWLRFLSWGMLILWFLATCSIVIGRLTDISLPIYDNAYPKIVTSIFMVVMCYFAIRQTPIVYFRGAPEGVPEKDNLRGNAFGERMDQPERLDQREMMDNHSGVDFEERMGAGEKGAGDKDTDVAAIDPISNKYRKSGLGAGQSKELYDRLLEEMETRKPYLDTDLTLFSLAAILSWSPNHLSQVINTYERKNFFDFVNGYRIEAIKKNIRSQQYEHLTLLSIAYECGFNSKAAFNRAFKKSTGLTPSAFRRGE